MITLAQLVSCIANNAEGLVSGSILVNESTQMVSFEIEELGIHDVTAGVVSGKIVDTAEGSDTVYETIEAYAAFLRREE